MLKRLVFLFFVPMVFVACKQQIDVDNLYGKWKYIRVEHNNEPTDTTQAGELASEKPYIEFTRDGLTNPGGINKRSTLQRVAYLCQDDRLVRRSWQATDMSEREQYHDQTLLSHLKACHFGFLHQSLQIFQEWDGIEQNRKNEMISLPKAIQFNVTLEDGGEGPLLFAIPEAVYQNV